MRNVNRFLLAGVAALSLSGCSHYDYNQMTGAIYGPQGLIHPAKPKYLAARDVSDLKIPPGLSKHAIRPLYRVPALAHTSVTKANQQLLRLPPESVVEKVQQSEATNASGSTSAKLSQQKVIRQYGKSNYLQSQAAGLTLVVHKSKLQTWQWLGRQLPTAGVRIVSQDEKQATYTIRGLSSGPGLQVVHVKTLSKEQSQIWVTSRFGKRPSDSRVSFMLKRLLAKV